MKISLQSRTRFRLRFKLIFFVLLYSLAFYLFRTSSYYNYRFLYSNLDSLPWLYSTIGLIFGIISAFIIQKEWQQWNDLVDSVKSENSALYELWLWADTLNDGSRVRPLIKEYLSIVITEGWTLTEAGEISPELDRVIKAMHQEVSAISKAWPTMANSVFALLSNVMVSRERRIRFGSSHMPRILLSTFRLATLLMVLLCPLIVIRAYELHFLFSLSIALLSYTVYIVAYDMDQPLKPGGWHLTTIDYRKLLDKLEADN